LPLPGKLIHLPTPRSLPPSLLRCAIEAPSQEKIDANIKKEASYGRHEEVEAAVERAREVFEIMQVGREGRKEGGREGVKDDIHSTHDTTFYIFALLRRWGRTRRQEK
jgi:hypothetical protein